VSVLPTHIGQYRIIRTIGAGGMGTVFLGEHLLLGRRAAVKVLHPSLAVHKQIVERFFTEARAMSSIHDPGVAQIFDFGYAVDGTAYIVMEFLEGEPLSARIDRLGVLPVGHALRIARQLAGSLDAAHAAGVVHRDLKPDNIFLVRDPEALGGARTKLLDFGICKLGVGSDARVTQTGVMVGTPVYMSPEQCRGSGDLDHRSDIYSLGAVLFHMLTGRPPFDHDSIGELIAAHIHDEPRPPSKYVDIPETLDALVMACMRKDPNERFKSMAELQAAIDAYLTTLPGNTPIEVPIVERVSDPTPPWFCDSQHPPAYHTEPPITLERKRRFGGFQRTVLAIALLAGIGIGMSVTRNLLNDTEASAHPAPAAAFEPAVAAQPAPAATVPAPPPAADEQWPEPIQPSPEAEKAVDEIAQPATTTDKTIEKTIEKPRPVAAKPRPTIRRSPPTKRTPPPTPAHADTEDLYDSR
jgi:serine/threonine protein kinase